MNTIVRTSAVICIFSIAMAALESAVVVYLRALYYPDGFTVAFRLIDESIIRVEFLRELATLVMLFTVGYIAGKTFNERFAYFLLAFAVWDIFYYGWLKVLLNWPQTIVDWDILFLIPFTWVGPVLAPLICSLTMIVLSAVLLSRKAPVTRLVWGCLITGSLFILYTFMQDYAGLIIGNGFIDDYPLLLQNEEFLEVASGFEPQRFNWLIFMLGELLLVVGIYFQYRGLGGVRAMAGAKAPLPS